MIIQLNPYIEFMADDENENGSAPESGQMSLTYRIVPPLITVLCLGFSFVFVAQAFPLDKTLLYVVVIYFWIAAVMAIISKFPSGAGMPVKTPIGAKVAWRLVFMIAAIFTLVFAVTIGLPAMFMG